MFYLPHLPLNKPLLSPSYLPTNCVLNPPQNKLLVHLLHIPHLLLPPLPHTLCVPHLLRVVKPVLNRLFHKVLFPHHPTYPVNKRTFHYLRMLQQPPTLTVTMM
jgi:hypothetical protein